LISVRYYEKKFGIDVPVRTCTKSSLGLVESIESKVFNLASNGHDICEEHSSRPGG
jgi:hypothetical protein